jgi:excisionase family DNA binding protein
MREPADSGKEPLPPKEFYSLREVASMLDVSERTMRELLQSGEVFGHKLKGQWRIPLAEIERLRRPKPEAPQPEPVEPDVQDDPPAAPYGAYEY